MTSVGALAAQQYFEPPLENPMTAVRGVLKWDEAPSPQREKRMVVVPNGAQMDRSPTSFLFETRIECCAIELKFPHFPEDAFVSVEFKV